MDPSPRALRAMNGGEWPFMYERFVFGIHYSATIEILVLTNTKIKNFFYFSVTLEARQTPMTNWGAHDYQFCVGIRRSITTWVKYKSVILRDDKFR